MSIPLYLPNQFTEERNNKTILAGDIGGTKSNLAIFKSENGKMNLLTQASYHSSEFSGVAAVIKKFVQSINLSVPDCISLGVAGPVLGDNVEITNLNWNLNAKDLAQETGAKKILLLNDLEANAYGLAGLNDDDFITLHKGTGTAKGNMAILAPGTGLGEAGLFWDGTSYHPFATEGGHCDFAPQSETDIALYRYLRKQFPHISWELVASGSAIHNLYLFLRDEIKMQEPEWLAAKLNADPQHASSIISAAAMDNSSGICVETMQLFVRFIARAACNLVLKMKSVGGLFLSGGIPPKNLHYFQSAFFYQSFIQCDRMGELVQSVPVKIIMNEKTPLLGAAYYGAFGAK